jgi:hypothetical protein
MFNFITLARKALLAASLVLFCGVAAAGPTYLVTIHTQAYSGESGLLDFSMGSDGDAAMAMATLFNFSGAFGAEYDRAGGVEGDLATGVTFTTGAPTNYLTHNVNLGEDFSFNISFSGDYESIDAVSGSVFDVVVYGMDLSDVLDWSVQFQLVPLNNGDAAYVTVDANPETTVVAEVVAADVPEPSQLLLMLSALALAGVALRRSGKHGK